MKTKVLIFPWLMATVLNSFGQDRPEEKFGWKIGVQCVSWGLTPLAEDLNKADSAGVKYLEGIVVQPIGGGIEGTLDYQMDETRRMQVLDLVKNKGIELASIGVVNPPDEAGYRKLFEFVKAMGMQQFSTEPAPALLPAIAKLAEEYKIKVAIHNHPYPSFYFEPDSLIKYVNGTNQYVGACADIGHWVRVGVDPVGALKKYAAAGIPVFEVHFKDMNEKPSEAYTSFMRAQPFGAWDFRKVSNSPPPPRDVPWGTGITDMDGVISQLIEQGFHGLVLAEYEWERGKNTELIAQSVGNLRSKLRLITSGSAATLPANTLLVVNNKENTVSFIDPANNKVLTKVNVGDGPHEVAVSPDGRWAFTSNYGSKGPGNSLSVIDLSKLIESRRVNLGPLRKPHGLAFNDGKLYFTAEVNKSIGTYDPVTDQIDWLMGTGQDLTHALMISEGGNRIFTSNVMSNSINVYERVTEKEAKAYNLIPGEYKTTIISVGKGPHGLALAPDGRELWVTNTRDSSLSIVDLGLRKVIKTLRPNLIVPKMVAMTADGKYMLVAEREGELVVLDRATRKVTNRFRVSERHVGMVLLSPDGTTTAYVTADKHVAVIDLKSMKQTAAIPLSSGLDGMAWIEK